MSSISNRIVKEMLETIKEAEHTKTTPLDVQATVLRVEGDTVWVQLPGGVDETPVKRTINASTGDVVQVRISGGRAWLTGNASSPPTDDTKALQATQVAEYSFEAANNAFTESERAHEAADEARATADSVHGIAVEAQTNAGIAKSAADKAAKDLSQVENVVGVVNWIAEHGTMTSQTGQTFDANKVYFVVDPNGDYHIGSTYYSVVQNPKAEDIDTYYLLSINESVQNYVSTHLYVDSEGLWLIPDDTQGSNKVLIAVGGQGHTHEGAGTYILDGSNDVLAKFLASGSQIGKDGGGNLLARSNGIAVREGLNELAVISADGFDAKTYDSNGDEVIIAHLGYGEGQSDTGTAEAPYYTFGIRDRGSTVGNYSVAEGFGGIASSYCSHAEGYATRAFSHAAHAEGSGTRASGYNSHAEGYQTEASGVDAHAGGESTKASGRNQIAIGRCNVADDNSVYALIIGNGANIFSRSNALTVDWLGRIECGDKSGTFKSIFDIFYPVGSYYETSDANFNPAAVWGGTWELQSPSAVSVRSKTVTVNAAQAYYTDTIELLENTSYILLSSTVGGQTADILTLSQVEVVTGTPAFIYNPPARTKSVSGQGVSSWAYIRTGSTKVTVAGRCYGYYTTSHSETIRIAAYPVNRSMSAYRWHRTG